MVESINIVELAFGVTAAVEKFLIKAKRFYYLVMLFGYRCPKCKGPLSMVAEGKCSCRRCKYEFDPTVEFQRCLDCGGKPVLRIRRYQCKKCGGDITSKFLFEGLVFEREYFKAKMAESRQRKKELKERVKKMLAESRSNALPLQTVDFKAVPDLVAALNSLTTGPQAEFTIESRDEFDLNRFQGHIQAHIGDFPVNLLDIPPLSENERKDVIWRFIAVIFLAHGGVVDIWQDGRDIMVKKHVDTKRCDIPDEIEGAGGYEESVGRIEA